MTFYVFRSGESCEGQLSPYLRYRFEGTRFVLYFPRGVRSTRAHDAMCVQIGRGDPMILPLAAPKVESRRLGWLCGGHKENSFAEYAAYTAYVQRFKGRETQVIAGKKWEITYIFDEEGRRHVGAIYVSEKAPANSKARMLERAALRIFPLWYLRRMTHLRVRERASA